MIKKIIQLLTILLVFATPTLANDEEVYRTPVLRMKNVDDFKDNSEVVFIKSTLIGGLVGLGGYAWMDSLNPCWTLLVPLGLLIGATFGSYTIESGDRVNVLKGKTQ